MSSSSETKVLARLIAAAFAAGFVISVDDGEGFAVKRSTDKAQIIEAATAVDMATLVFRDAATGIKTGWVLLVFGNASDGSELIADYSANPATEALVKTVEA